MTARTQWRSPISEEQERREAMLDKLPGKKHYERFDSLNRASQVFSGNGVELERLLRQFVGTGVHVNELPDGYDVEVMRRFHNYLASVGTLRDVQRTTHRKVWPKRVAPDDEANQKTVWEVDVYSPKTDELFGTDAFKFLFDLRNFTVHYSVPPLSLGTSIRWEGEGPMMQQNKVELKRSELIKFRSWSSAAKRYLRDNDGDIDFLSILQQYSTAARTFYGWFWQQVHEGVWGDVNEYLKKSCELGHWLAENNVGPDWSENGDPIPGSLSRNRAKARGKRAENGSTG